MKKLKLLQHNQRLFMILFVISVLAFFRYLFFNPISPDTWTHMAIGKIIVNQHHIPNHNDISFKKTDVSLEWLSHSWLSDSIMYIAANSDIRIGTVLLVVPIFIGTLYILYLICKHLKFSLNITLLSLSIASLILASFYRLHPLTLVSPLIPLLFLMYLKWRDGFEKIIFVWPIIFILWSNLAGGFVFIPFLFCLVIVVAELIRLILFPEAFPARSHKVRVFAFLVLAFVLSAGASLINPLFARIWFYVFTLIGVLNTKQWMSTLPGSLLIINQNFIRQSPSAILQVGFLAYSVVIIFTVVVSSITKRLTFIRQMLMFTPCFLILSLGFLWIRLIPLSTLASLPVAAAILTQFTSYKKPPQSLIIPIITLSAYVLAVYILLFPPRSFDFPLPITQANLIEKYSLPGNILTTQEVTGYLFYRMPDRKFLLDAQDDLFDENETISIFYLPNAVSDPVMQHILDNNNINTALVSKDVGGFARSLTKNPSYSLLYFDYSGFLFVDSATQTEKFLHDNSLLGIDITRNLGFNPDIATASAQELTAFTQKYPDNKMALGQLASIYRYLGNPQQAETVLYQIPPQKWDYIVYTELGRIKATEGQCEASEASYKHALKDRSERNYSRAILDLAVLYALCFNDKEKSAHYFNRYNSFVLDPVEREHVRELASEMGIKLDE